MAVNIQITPDSKSAGSEELAQDIRAELDALEIGEIKELTQKAKEGTLTLDIVTIGVIINAARLTFDLIKAIISIVKELQLRYADKKKVE
jgi:hypothetical protein